MPCLFVLIHLVNLIDNNYFGDSNEVRIVYVYTYDVVISLIMMIVCLYFEMMNCTCCVKNAKWGIRWVILSLIDVDKWWAYVDDLIRD